MKQITFGKKLHVLLITHAQNFVLEEHKIKKEIYLSNFFHTFFQKFISNRKTLITKSNSFTSNNKTYLNINSQIVVNF